MTWIATMPTFKINVPSKLDGSTQVIIVEAESVEEARAKVAEKVGENNVGRVREQTEPTKP